MQPHGGNATATGARGSSARRDRTAAIGRLLHRRYSRLFWALHSAWALISGGIVLVLAHNRYGFLPWVVLFLTLTWASTLFFSRFAAPGGSETLRFARGFVSYLTRVMYQETLFFLLPFYFYSTTFPSWNSPYVVFLAALAALSCFDRLLRPTAPHEPLVRPGVLRVRHLLGAPVLPATRAARPDPQRRLLAAGVSFFAALPLAYSAADLKQPRRKALIFVALVGIIVVLKVGRALIPPVPLRLAAISFATGIDPATLRLENELPEGGEVPASRLREGRLIVRATIFSPGRLPVRIQLRVARDGTAPEQLAYARPRRPQPRLPGLGLPCGSVAAGLAPGTYRAEAWTGRGTARGPGGDPRSPGPAPGPATRV